MKEETIILASDNSVYVEELREPLEKHGYRVILCHNGQAALDTIQDSRPRAVVTDLFLPKIDGIELTWMIRQHLKLFWMPVLILSASNDPEIRLNAFRSGVDGIISHPFTVRELLVRLDVMLARLEELQGKDGHLNLAIMGELQEFHLTELIQWLHNQKKSGRLWISYLYNRGNIYFEKGEIRAAHFGELEAEEAIFRLYQWQRGRFEFETGEFLGVANVEKTTLEILLECSQKMDERQQQFSELFSNR